VWHVVVVDQCLGLTVMDVSQTIDEYQGGGIDLCGGHCLGAFLDLSPLSVDADFDADVPCDGGLGAFDAGAG